MRKYTLASVTDRGEVDLRAYRSEIIQAVHEYMPDARVHVDKDCYLVDPAPDRGTAIRIGRRICESELKIYCIKIPKLFTSIEVKGETDGTATRENRKKEHTGGHK